MVFSCLYYCHYSFRFYPQNKTYAYEVEFEQVSYHCKKDLEAANLVFDNKIKEAINSQKLGSRNFWRIPNSVLNKVDLKYLHY